ncbi:43603_t:CDS:2, partial [Gigaspora margarita]
SKLQQTREKLLEDLISSFEKHKFADTKIIVGENEKPEIIYANSFIIIIRSEYFQSALSNKFLYGADFKIPSHDTRTLLNTFLLADEMRIMELRDVLKSYFTENFIIIMEDLEFIKMIILHDDIKKILLKKLCLKPELLFNFENKQIPENIFYELISMSELCLEEHKLLNKVIQYWMDTNYNLTDCIRFNQITDDEFRDIIRKCKWNKIKTHILNVVESQFKDNKNKYYYFRDGNFCLKSEILDLDTAKQLITWISNGKTYHECWYKFELLFNMKRDGLESETFHKNCDGKGATIVIIKLYDDNLIVLLKILPSKRKVMFIQVAGFLLILR